MWFPTCWIWWKGKGYFFCFLLTKTNHPKLNPPPPPQIIGESYLQNCVDIFLDRIDHVVEASVPTSIPFKDKLEKAVANHALFLEENIDHENVAHILGK